MSEPEFPPRTVPVVRLLSCRSCRRFVQPREEACPFCGADVAATFNAWAEKKARLAAALAAVDAIFAAPAPKPIKRPRRA